MNETLESAINAGDVIWLRDGRVMEAKAFWSLPLGEQIRAKRAPVQSDILRLLLTRGELTACQIAQETNRSMQSALYLLTILRRKNFVYQPRKRFWAVKAERTAETRQ
jgi:hypothetical protein